MSSGPVRIEVDASEFAALLGKTSKVEAKLKAQLRKDIKTVAEKAALASRQEVSKPPLERGKHPQNRHLRQSIASNIKVQIAANSARGAGVVIKAGASGLEGERKKLVRAYNSEKGWRHPVFARIHVKSRTGSVLKAVGAGSTAKDFEKAQRARRRANATWVSQKGRPYFQKVIRQHADDVRKAVENALKAATASLK